MVAELFSVGGNKQESLSWKPSLGRNLTPEQMECTVLGFVNRCFLGLLIKAQSIGSVLFIPFFESSCLRLAHSEAMIIRDCKRMMAL